MKFTNRMNALNSGVMFRGLLILTVGFFLIGASVFAADSPQADATKQVDPATQLFNSERAYYLYERSIDFSSRMVDREAFLKWLYDGINTEVRKRRKEDPASTLRVISPPEIAKLDNESYGLPTDWQKLSPGQKYQYWEEAVSKEFNRNYLEARLIKDGLLDKANPEQLARMFKTDLTQAFYAYRDDNYRLAISYFDELIERYPYSNMSDLMFYRGESYFALKLFDRAYIDYETVVKRCDDRELRRIGYGKMLIIAGDAGQLDMAVELWGKYQSESSDEDEEYWRIADMAARYLFDGNRFKAAQEIFDQVPVTVKWFGSSVLRAADCALRQYNLDEAEQRYLSIIKERTGAKKINPDVIDEARLKLGYIDFLRGDYDLAFVNFSSLKGKSPILTEKAMIASCWALYKLDVFPQAIKLSERFIRDYPVSEQKYQALCIIGYCKEKSGQFDPAAETYTKVMSAVDERKGFRDLTYEKLDITNLLQEIKRLEPLVFMSGRADLYEDYRDLRYRMTVMYDRARIAEGIKASPILANLMEEQREILRAMNEQVAFEKELVKNNAIDMYYEYEDAILLLMDLSTDLDLAIKFHLENNKEVIQVEEQRVLDAMRRDSLLVGLHKEWKYTDRALQETRESMSNSRDISPKALVDLAGLEVSLLEVQDKMIDVRQDLGDEDIGALKTKSNLDTWSDFAYQRYTYGGLNFENLSAKRKKLNQVDEYIQQINQLLSDKMLEVVDTSDFPPDLMPTSPEGVTAYYAPPIPLWNAETSAFFGYGEVDEEEIPVQELQPEMNPVPVAEPITDPATSPQEDGNNSSQDIDEDDTNVPPPSDDSPMDEPESSGDGDEIDMNDEGSPLVDPIEDDEQDAPPDTTGQQSVPDEPVPSGSDDN